MLDPIFDFAFSRFFRSLPSHMNALVLEAYRQFAYQEIPTPTPAADEVLLAVKACGICGSDVHGSSKPGIKIGRPAGREVPRDFYTRVRARSDTRKRQRRPAYCGHQFR